MADVRKMGIDKKQWGYSLMGIDNVQLFISNQIVPITFEQYEVLKDGYQKLYGIYYIIMQNRTITLLPTKDVRESQQTQLYDPETAMDEIERISRQVRNYEEKIKEQL